VEREVFDGDPLLQIHDDRALLVGKVTLVPQLEGESISLGKEQVRGSEEIPWMHQEVQISKLPQGQVPVCHGGKHEPFKWYGTDPLGREHVHKLQQCLD